MKPGNFPGAVENGDGPVPIFEDSHIGFDEVMSVRAFRDLQHKTLIANAIVGRDDAFLLDAQDIGEIADKGNEGRSLLCRLGAKAGVVLRDINVSKPSIVRAEIGRASCRERVYSSV